VCYFAPRTYSFLKQSILALIPLWGGHISVWCF